MISLFRYFFNRSHCICSKHI